MARKVSFLRIACSLINCLYVCQLLLTILLLALEKSVWPIVVQLIVIVDSKVLHRVQNNNKLVLGLLGNWREIHLEWIETESLELQMSVNCGKFLISYCIWSFVNCDLNTYKIYANMVPSITTKWCFSLYWFNTRPRFLASSIFHGILRYFFSDL